MFRVARMVPLDYLARVARSDSRDFMGLQEIRATPELMGIRASPETLVWMVFQGTRESQVLMVSALVTICSQLFHRIQVLQFFLLHNQFYRLFRFAKPVFFSRSPWPTWIGWSSWIPRRVWRIWLARYAWSDR